MLHLTALLGIAAISQASPVHEAPSTGQLLLQHPTSRSPPPACASFHGRLPTKAHTGLYYAAQECATTSGARGIPFDWSDGRLLWVGDSALDEGVAELVTRRDQLRAARTEQQQQVFGVVQGWRVLTELGGDDGELIQIEDDEILRSWTQSEEWALKEMVAISMEPLVAPATSKTALGAVDGSTVPSRDVQRIQDHLDELRFSPLISTLLSTFGKKDFVPDVRYLSGEDQSAAVSDDERWVSRHSMSEGAIKASNWLLQRFRLFGFVCEQHTFLPGFAPMVECQLPGTGDQDGKEANETVIIGAHFDSRGSFGYPTAPGADDDGSGTSALLSIAEHIWRHRLTFSRKVVLAAFAGEEQGLLGSKFYASKLRKAKEDVVLFVQMDMLAYRSPGEPLQLARPDLIGLPEAAYLVGNISEIYVPQLQVGYTPGSSFVDNNYAATWVFERNGPIADPCYHNSCDLSKREGYSFEQLAAASSVVFATLLEVAGFAFV